MLCPDLPALILTAADHYFNDERTGHDPWSLVGSANHVLSERTDAVLNVGYARNKEGSRRGLNRRASDHSVAILAPRPAGDLLGRRQPLPFLTDLPPAFLPLPQQDVRRVRVASNPHFRTDTGYNAPSSSSLAFPN